MPLAVLVGFWLVLVNEFGPLQEYVSLDGVELRLKLLYEHTGPLLEAVTVGGVFTVTLMLAVALQLLLLTVTV